ncbi:MATE family Na+-driven efflux transporter [Malacoplasma iowae]|uniref:Uncharacterized protein n=2 Tax=Malacoplasma iowae TaxID=2116 RepID=A0A6P1LFR7_MALIO|nr:MATE family Na+-driven efflux transporter [Malacoplasma iowae]QHG89470.1 hypothetical protein EER00_00975 [Malacoplasma iowae 695]WPL35808.1 hypothetical protein QX180_00075 [Malacoplasma iowae]VEU62970.1 Uncharacterised protein [Mycoplasmopsis fermentans]VEU71720.1 Uncharacterised protein [Malacoplasma iowae]
MQIKQALKQINFKILFAIFLTLLIPTIYKIFRIFWLGSFPDDSQLNIASQLSWINLIYEVIQESLILPLYCVIGNCKDNRERSNRIKTSFLVIVIFYLVVMVFIIIFAKDLVNLLGQSNGLINETITYIRLETVAALFLTSWKFFIIVITIYSKQIYLYIILISQMSLSILFDTFLVSNLNFSAKLGANGIAITNIIVNLVIVGLALILLKQQDINFFERKKWSFKWTKIWFKQGLFSGVESFIRNLVFSLVIIRMVNLVNQQGNYWIANSFIWDWLLLPSLALSDLIKRDIGESGKKSIENNTCGYILIVIALISLWLISIPSWKPFIKYVLNAKDYNSIYNIVLIQTGFYITFLFNNCIFDSTFYGYGKTSYMLIQSICINIIYYGIVFTLFLLKLFVPNLLNIVLMFGIGMVLDFIPSLFLFIWLIKKEKIKIKFKNFEIINKNKKTLII